MTQATLMPALPASEQCDTFARDLLQWWDQHGRKTLPWQQDITPYRVWVSEIMLQQTQVATVIAYFQRFMQRFPTVFALAAAQQDEVLHLWTGLGYYARARNLHRCAQQLVNEYQGEFPQQVQQVMQLPGIGRSTAAAILSISLQVPEAILDGNVKRVLTRYCALPGWPGSRDSTAYLWQLEQQLTPKVRVGQYNQAMMDLGALLCTRHQPQCERCPLQAGCQAYRQGLQSALPAPKPKAQRPIKPLVCVIMQLHDGRVYLHKRPSVGIWGGLFSFPEYANDQQAQQALMQQGIEQPLQPLPCFDHGLSHYILRIQPLWLRLAQRPAQVEDLGQGLWYDPQLDQAIGLAAPVKKMIQQVTKQHVKTGLLS